MNDRKATSSASDSNCSGQLFEPSLYRLPYAKEPRQLEQGNRAITGWVEPFVARLCQHADGSFGIVSTAKAFGTSVSAYSESLQEKRHLGGRGTSSCGRGRLSLWLLRFRVPRRRGNANTRGDSC